MTVSGAWSATRSKLGAALRRARRSLRSSGLRRSLAELEALTARRQYAEAVALGEELVAANRDDRYILQQAGTAFRKAGAMTLQLEELRAERRVKDSASLAEFEARVLGRWRETSAEWRPDVDGEPEPLSPASDSRVLHLLKVASPYRQSGYTMRSKYILAAQRSAGIEPVVMTYIGFPRSVGVNDAPRVEEIDGVRHIRLDPASDYDLNQPNDRLIQDFVTAAASHVRELAPAVIHAHSGQRGYDIALVGLALGRHFELPVVYEARGFFESMWTSDIEWAERSETYERRLATETRCMNEADAVVTLSESMKAEIVRWGVPAEKVHVVPNGVDLDAFGPRRRSARLVDRYGLGECFTFGYVSNLDHPRESQETLIDAAVALRDRGIRATALIVGDGKRRDLLERYADDRDATSAVVFTGQVPHHEVLDYYALLDVFVIPRIDERGARLVTPLKPFEAMAAGIALVTSDLPALLEVTGAGERGRHFAAGDPNSLVDVLTDLHADPEQRRALAERARDWVVAERQWSANGPRYAELYRPLVGNIRK